MVKYLVLCASSIVLAACGDTTNEGARNQSEAPASSANVSNVSIELATTCALLSMDDLASVFPGQDFVAEQGEVTTIGNSGSECVYELSEQGPGRYLAVRVTVTNWGNLSAANDAFELIADPGSDGFDPISGVGDKAGYVDFNSLQEVMAIAGTYVISIAVTNPRVDDFDIKSPAVDLANRLAKRL